MVRQAGVSRVARVRRWVLSRSWFELTTATVLVVLLVSGLFGGLREVDTDPVVALQAGQAVSAQPLQVKVTGAYTTNSFGGVEKKGDTPQVYPDTSKRGRFVVVEAEVENTSEATVGYDVLSRAVSLDEAGGFFPRAGGDALVPADEARPYAVYTMPEKAVFGVAQPGLTYRVAYLFEQSSTTAPGARVTTVVNRHTWREDSLDFHFDWKDPEPQASGSIPLPARNAP